MVVPAGSVVPVYAGSTSFSVMAKMESSVALNIPAYGTVDIAFRGDLATTAARELIDFMRTKSPVIAPERSPLLVIRSVDGTVRNAVNEAMRVASTKIVCGAYTWNVRKTWNGKSVTIQQALEAVNSRYDVSPFVWEGRKLKTICGAVVEPFDLERIPCVETDEGIVIGWNDISKPLAVDELRFGVMKADVFIVGKGRRWNDLAKEGQAKLIAQLRNLESDATAQYFLGVCYENGLGVDKSSEKAARCYRKSAEQGNAFAQSSLGLCYATGEGVEQSCTEAVKWFRKSAEQGNAFAQSGLGLCYATGEGVEQSYTEAVKWFRKSAEQGNAFAQNNLGWCYAKGEGVEQSYAKAVEWLYKAAEQGDAMTQWLLGFYYARGQGVVQSYEEAVKWYRKSAEQGCARAQESLGVCYANGEGVEKSVRKAMYWLRKAKENGVELNEGQLRYMERHKDE